MNSISEVTVNTLSYSVDQGRYGASQIDYVTKSGSNQFHGNAYETWNGAALNAADYFTNATPGNQKPQSSVNHFGGSLGGPILHDKLFFFSDFEWMRLALPIVTPATVPTPAFQNYVLQQLPLGGIDSVTGSSYPAAPQLVPFYQKMFSLYGNTSGTPLAVLGCPFNAQGLQVTGNPPNGDGCANRQIVSHTSKDHEQVQTVRMDYNIDANDTAWFRFQADTGIASPVHRSHQFLIQLHLVATPIYVRRGIHPRFLTEPGELLQPRIHVVCQSLRTQQLSADAGGLSDRIARPGSQCAVQQYRRARQHLGSGKAGEPLFYQ